MSQPKKKNNRRLMNLATIPVASIVLGFAAAVLVSLFVLQNALTSQHRNLLIEQAANEFQWRIDQKQIQLIRQLNAFATNQALVELLATDDEQARVAEEKRLAETIPHATHVLLIRPSEARVDRDADPPFTYTSLDLANRVEQGETNSPDALRAGDRWLITAAARIRSSTAEAPVSGVMFVYFDLTVLSENLADSLPGQIQLIQSFGSSETEFLTVGSGNTALQLRRNLLNSNWQLRFNPSEELSGAKIGDVVTYLLPGIAALLITLTGVIFGLYRMAVILDQDTSQLILQMKDAAKRKFNHLDTYQLPQFSELDDTLSELDDNLSKLGSQVSPSSIDEHPVAALDAEPENGLVDIEMVQDGSLVGAQEASLEGSPEEIDRNHDSLVSDEILEFIDDIDVTAIFRAYDIRGIVGETLDATIVKRIGLSIGTEAGKIDEQTLIVGADGRLSSAELLEALIEGISQSGRDVVNIGFVPTPLLYYATSTSDFHSGVMITGSHNPSDHNGLKIVLDGRTLVDDDIQTLYQTYTSQEFSSGTGQVSRRDIRDEYLDVISEDVVVAQPLKVILDCGNGIAGEIAPRLLSNLGCEVVPLFCEVDGNFPNHHPDPIDPANLEDLIKTVLEEAADIGIALDGDGDRMVAITKTGDIVWPDRLLMLFAKDVVSRNPGSDVIYDVKCTRHLNSLISGIGGRPIICRTGHSFLKAKMLETNAILGGEMSGHICFKERWYGFDDGLYAAARLLEIVGSQSEGLGELLEEFPISSITPEIQLPVEEDRKFAIVEQLIENDGFEGATLNTIDGLRVEFADRWGLIRPSNTNACLTLRFEADNEEALTSIQNLIREKLISIDKSLTFRIYQET